jgi:HSP20 family protein
MPTSIRKSRSNSPPAMDSRREVLQAVGWQVQVRTGAWSPPTDVYETINEYVVRVEIAGMQEEEFEIFIENDLIFIRGNRSDIPERRAYQQMEIRFGKFETAVGIPGPIDVEAARADYKEGFLTVTLPKAQTLKIEVEEE